MKYVMWLLILVSFAAGVLWFNIYFDKGNTEQNARLYWYDASRDLDDERNVLCSEKGLVGVERDIPLSINRLEETIKLLMRGEITPTERSRGISTEFPLRGVELIAAVLDRGTLTLTIDDPHGYTNGGACRVSILRAQIEATARQFSGVSNVVIQPEDIFQP